MLTGIHAACGTIGCLFFYQRGTFTLTRLSDKENLTLLAFSTLYTINIAISNVSLYFLRTPALLRHRPELTPPVHIATSSQSPSTRSSAP